MSRVKDITHAVERLESFEERFGVRLNALYATLEGPDSDGDYTVTLNGELRPESGEEIEGDVQLNVAMYDEAGRVVGKTETNFYADSFFGFEAFSVSAYVKGVRPAVIRVYPKAT